MDEKNMNEVVEAADEIIESTDSINVKEVGCLGLMVVGVAAIGYGIFKGSKAIVSKIKRNKLKKEAERQIDDVDSFEDFEEEVHEID